MSRMTISYCGTCNYRPIAASLSREIEAKTGIKSELVHSQENGVFEISMDDELIYSKRASGRFPEFSDIIETVREKKKG